MQITREDVLHVAELARLRLDETEVDTYVRQITDILAYVDQLNEVDTTGVPPTSHAIRLTNAFREDRPGTHLETDRAVANAPAAEDGLFCVPKIIS